MTMTATSTKAIDATASEILTHTAVAALIKEELCLAIEALQRKAQKQKGLKTIRTSLQPSGRIFGVTVETEDGDIRVMACRFGVKVGQKNLRHSRRSKSHGKFVIYEMINQSTNCKRTILKLQKQIVDLEARLAAGVTAGRRRRLEKALANKRRQLAKPVLKPSYRTITLSRLKGLRIRGRRIQVEGCSE